VADLFDVKLDEGVIVVRYDGRPDDTMFERYLAQYARLVMRKVPYAAVYSSLPGARMPHPSHVRRQTAWLREHQDTLREHCCGLGFALRSPLMRGVLRAVLTMQALGAPHVVMDDEADAIAWARARLSAARC